MNEETEVKTKTCCQWPKGCGKTKPYSAFNNTDWGDKKTPLCQTCQRLRHKALVIAAHRAGYLGRRQWIKALPFSDRKPFLEKVFQELLLASLDTIDSLETIELSIEPKPPKKQPDLFLRKILKELGLDIKKQKVTTDPLLLTMRKSKADSCEVRAIKAQLRRMKYQHTDGWLYIASNPAWPNSRKIGETTDYERRLNHYQTGCPNRDYIMNYEIYVEDRITLEGLLKVALIPVRSHPHPLNEWFNIGEIQLKEYLHRIQAALQQSKEEAWEVAIQIQKELTK